MFGELIILVLMLQEMLAERKESVPALSFFCFHSQAMVSLALGLII